MSQRLLEQQGAIRLRADVERKRLFGIGMLDNSRDAGLDIYTAAAGRRTYARLLSRAAFALRAGYPVILDAAHLHRHQRDAAHALARRLGAAFTIATCEAPQPFGDLALMYNAPRAATIRAIEPCTLWTLDRVFFRQAMVTSSSNQNVQLSQFLSKIALFETIGVQKLNQLARSLTKQSYDDGQYIIKQGDIGDQFYVLYKGTSAISFNVVFDVCCLRMYFSIIHFIDTLSSLIAYKQVK